MAWSKSGARWLFGLMMLCASLLPSGANAQAYPNRTITVIVAFGAAGVTDSMGRLVAKNLSERLKVPVIVDGAHAFAQFPFQQPNLGCDYYGTSLHKWLMAPIGTGMLFVRKPQIEALWPMMAATSEQSKDIRKFEEIGTHPAANHNAISEALLFNENLGIDRKAARLRYLRPLGQPADAASQMQDPAQPGPGAILRHRVPRFRARRGCGQDARNAVQQIQHHHDVHAARRL